MRSKALVLLGIFLFNIAIVIGGSSTVAEFNIGGCTFDYNGGTVGVAVGECSTEPFGAFYCDDNKYGWTTTELGYGCSRGIDTYARGSDSCCPSGMACNEYNDEFKCEARGSSILCRDQKTSGSCNNADCVWLDLIDTCVDNVMDIDCGYYASESDCEDDDYNLGKIGVGTEVAGTYFDCADTTFSVPKARVECKWYSTGVGTGECRLSYSAIEAGGVRTALDNIFSCSKVQTLGECIEGKQVVKWNATSSKEEGFVDVDIPDSCLVAFNCEDGSGERYCGEHVFKLPGFSLFALFASLFIIGIYYFFKEY